MPRSILAVLVVLCTVSARAELPVGVPYVARLASSADPTGGNNDRGNYLRREGDRAILMEAAGPGQITRVWSANPSGTLSVYLDDLTKPALSLPFAQLTSTAAPAKLRPECSEAGGGICWRPRLTYAKQARIEVVGAQQLYYQINYRQELGPIVSASGPKPRRESPPSAVVSVGAGQTVPLFDLAGPTVLQHLRIEPRGEATLAEWRALRLRCTWDRAAGPSVDVPLADLAGASLGQPPASPWVPGANEKLSVQLPWPMPVASHARLEVVNTGHTAVSLVAQVKVSSEPLAPEDRGYLCLSGEAGPTIAGEPHTVLAVQARGVYLATLVELYGDAGLQFLEGDERFEVDGDHVLAGTGTEDYFDGAWFFRAGPYQAPYAGAPLLLDGKRRVVAYRQHTDGDAIGFSRSLRVTLEHGPNNDAAGATYRTLAVWRCDQPYVSPRMPRSASQPPFTEKQDGLVIIEGERLGAEQISAVGGEAKPCTPDNSPLEASGGQALFVAASRPSASLVLQAPHPGLWEVGLRGVGGSYWQLQGVPAEQGRRSLESLGYCYTNGALIIQRGEATWMQPSIIDYFWLAEVGKIKGAIEAESLVTSSAGTGTQVVREPPPATLRSTALIGGAVPIEPVLSGGSGLQVADGTTVGLPIEIAEPGDYGLSASWLQMPEGGKAQVRLDNTRLGEVETRLDRPEVGGRWGLGTHQLGAGQHQLWVSAKGGPVVLDYLLLTAGVRGHEGENLLPLPATQGRCTTKLRFGAEPRYSGGGYVFADCTPTEPLEFALFVPRGGQYRVLVKPVVLSDGVAATLTINGRPAGEIECQGAAEGLGEPAEHLVTLRRGQNVLRAAVATEGVVALDVIELERVRGSRLPLALAIIGVGVLAGLAVVFVRRRRSSI